MGRISSSAEEILNGISSRTGWNDQSKIQLLLEYIENQQSNDAFFDFLSDKEFQENCA